MAIVYDVENPPTIGALSNNLRYLAENVNATFEQCYNVLIGIAYGCTNAVPSALTVLCYMVTAISKRGNVSDRFIVKFIDGVRSDTGVTISNGQFSEIVQNIWRQMGNQINPDVAAVVKRSRLNLRMNQYT